MVVYVYNLCHTFYFAYSCISWIYIRRIRVIIYVHSVLLDVCCIVVFVDFVGTVSKIRDAET